MSCVNIAAKKADNTTNMIKLSQTGKNTDASETGEKIPEKRMIWFQIRE